MGRGSAYLPEEISPELQRHLASFANLRHKAMIARDRGARGLIVASGPNAKTQKRLVELSLDTTLAGTSIAALSITDEMAEQWLQPSGKHLKMLQDALDAGKPLPGFVLADLSRSATIDIQYEKRLCQAIRWSPQTPARRARQRDDAAIAHWREETWPAIKKGRKSSSKRSSS